MAFNLAHIIIVISLAGLFPDTFIYVTVSGHEYLLPALLSYIV
jgi:hypothetical protein